ncbi:MAG TPA: hypothetical protein VG433_14775 [Pirellulales bacterium]|nr:hypothetical protein [Pirellulales bacterium]
MSLTALLALLFRWLHILAGMTAVGGTIFARFVVLPSQDVLAPDARNALATEMRRRWSKIVMASIGFLLLTGLCNFAIIVVNYRDDLHAVRWYHPLFGVKFLLALAVFTIASLLSGRTALADRVRQRARFWMSLNILLAVLIVCLSGILRTAHPPGTLGIGAEPVKAKAVE